LQETKEQQGKGRQDIGFDMPFLQEMEESGVIDVDKISEFVSQYPTQKK